MEKKNFISLIMGTVGGILFAIGMCMCLLPQWNAFKPGIVLGVVGLVLAVVTVIVWRKMEHKAPVHLSGKAVLTILVGIVGALAFGVGMCFSMVWGNMVLGIVIGLAGIAVLLCLIPLTKGIKD